MRKDNKSFGATTLRTPPRPSHGPKMMMRFAGKHGIVHEVKITDSNLKRIVKRCQDLPGPDAVSICQRRRRAAGRSLQATSTTISRRPTGGDFTAKHFRTWGASVIAFDQLLKKAEDARISVKTVVEPVAEALGNTAAMSRKSYVHPALIEAVKDDPRDPLNGMERPRARKPPVDDRGRPARISRPRRQARATAQGTGRGESRSRTAGQSGGLIEQQPAAMTAPCATRYNRGPALGLDRRQ